MLPLGLLLLSTTDPEVLIVEGTRLDLSALESGTAVTTITAEDLSASGITYAIDAIANTPGISVNQNGAFGGVGTIRIRGVGADQVVVLIDGIPAGDTSSVGGAFDFARLDASQIERIEILRGPQSTLWGSEAIGGVISITTRKGDGGADFFAEGGSFGTLRGGAALSQRSQDGGWRLAVVGLNTDGISKADRNAGNTEIDGHRSHSLSASADQRLGALTVETRLFASSAETELDSFDFMAPGSVADGNARAETDELNASTRLLLNSGAIEHQLLVGGNVIERTSFDEGFTPFSASGKRGTLRYQGNITPNDRTSIAFGAEADFRRSDGNDASIHSMFGLGSARLANALTLSGGIRVDSHSQFGSEATGRVAAAWQARDGITLRASFGEGFKAPSLFQQTFFCCGATGPNLDLQPERSEGYDAGVILSVPRLFLEVGYFHQDIENLIDFSFTSGGYVNVAEAETQGIEASVEAALRPWLTLTSSFTLTHAEDGNGNELARVPEHKADASITVAPEGPWSSTLFIRYNGDEEDGGATVEDWSRVDFSATYQMTEKLEVYLRAENLLNASYQQVLGYGTPGRSGNIGVRASF